MLALMLRLAALALAFASAYACFMLLARHVGLKTLGVSKLSMEDVLRDRTLSFWLFAAAGIVVSYATTPWIAPLCLLAAYVLSKRAPRVLDERRKRELRSACDKQLDTMADIVAMGVESGLSFDAALELYCEKFENELAGILRDAQLQWTSGLASRKRALIEAGEHVDSKALRRFSETSVQAIQHGSPLASMLRRFSEDVRRQRKSAIERQIEKAPVKMLIPTGTCILPAMLILVMGPVVLQFIQSSY